MAKDGTTGEAYVVTIGPGAAEDIALLACACWLKNEDGTLVYLKAAGAAATVTTIVPTLVHNRDKLYDFTFTPDTPASGSGEWVYFIDDGAGLYAYDRALIRAASSTMPEVPAGSPYADAEAVAAFMGILEAALPSDIERLCQRASDMIDYLTFGNLDITDTDQATAVQNAACAQVEHWINHGEDEDTHRAIKSYSKGKVSITYAMGDEPRVNDICSRARRYLMHAGLLYRAVTEIT